MKLKIVAGALLLAAWLLLTFVVLSKVPGPAGSRAGAQNMRITPKVNVVVTIPILKDIVWQTSQTYVNVDSIIAHDVEVLDFRPRPRDVVKIHEADVLVKVGAGFDDWVSEITADLDRDDLVVVDLSRNVGLLDRNGRTVVGDAALLAGRADPYFWLDPGNVREMVLAIHLAIISVLPQASKYLAQRREEYFAELDSLSSDMASELARVSKVKMVAACDGMFYLAKRFDLAILGRLDEMLPRIIQPQAIAEVARTLSSRQVRIIVADELSQASVPEQLVGTGQFGIAVLASAVGGSRNTGSYMALMRCDALALMAAVDKIDSEQAQQAH